jgi:hypothetical protein
MKVSAAELRAAGISIADRIPDCATIDRSGIHYRLKGVTSSQDRVITFDMEVEFTAPFEWITLSAEVGKTLETEKKKSA